jgi:uncharacterized protein
MPMPRRILLAPIVCLLVLAALCGAPGLPAPFAPAPARAEFVIPPAPGKHIIDKAAALDAGSLSYLEERLTRFERATGHQFVIAIFKSIDGDDLETVSNKLFRAWGLGDKTANDGILLAIFFDERISRIEVGYGLEGVLTDARCARILRNEFQPEFQTGRYGQGLRRVVQAVEQIVTDPSSAPPDPEAGKKRDKSSSSFWIAILAFFVILVVMMAASAASRKNGAEYTRSGRRGYRDPWDGGWGGGGFGGFGGGWGGGGGGWGGFSGGGGGFSGGGGSSGGGGASGKW